MQVQQIVPSASRVNDIAPLIHIIRLQRHIPTLKTHAICVHIQVDTDGGCKAAAPRIKQYCAVSPSVWRVQNDPSFHFPRMRLAAVTSCTQCVQHARCAVFAILAIRVHSSVVRATDCISSGPWLNPGCGLACPIVRV